MQDSRWGLIRVEQRGRITSLDLMVMLLGLELGTDWLESSAAEMDLEILVDNKLTVNHQWTLMTKEANSFLGFIRKSVAGGLREVILPPCATLVRPHLQYFVRI